MYAQQMGCCDDIQCIILKQIIIIVILETLHTNVMKGCIHIMHVDVVFEKTVSRIRT